MLLLWIIFVVVLSVHCSLVVTYWEGAYLLVVMFCCVFVTLPCGVLGQVWCLIFRFLIFAFFLTLLGAYDNLYPLLATGSFKFTCIIFQVQVKTPSVRIVVKNCQIDIIEPRHEISKMWYVRPEKPQISLRIRAV